MLDKLTNKNQVTYTKLSPEEQSKRGILGRLYGVIADFRNPTRNGRRYSEELWDKVFDDPIMEEKIVNKCVFGELGHPADRDEIDLEKVAISLAEKPSKGPDGKIYGVFDILNTPNGKILKSLCDYGCTIGVSSRGTGETFTDYDGQEAVDPDTYDCVGWDAVLIPAVKEARVHMVNESINNKTLKQTLNEELEKASEDDRKIMEKTLEDLDLMDNDDQVLTEIPNDLNMEISKIMKDNPLTNDEIIDAINTYISNRSEKNVTNKEVPDTTAVDNAEATILNELQEALNSKADLEKQLLSVNEKLSVCYAKETKLNEQIEKYKSTVSKLVGNTKKVGMLENEVSKLTSINEDLNNRISKQTTRNNSKVQKLSENVSILKRNQKKLVEGINNRNNQINTLTESIDKLTTEKESLNKQVASLQKDLTLKKTEYNNKLETSKKMVEQYKKIASKAVDKYIESEAIKLGVSSNEIKNRLPQKYSFKDIDLVCEDLQDYKLNMNSIPFRISSNNKNNIRMDVKNVKSESLLKTKTGHDDEVDDDLLSLAGLN